MVQPEMESVEINDYAVELESSMKLVSFQVRTPVGPFTRVGAIQANRSST